MAKWLMVTSEESFNATLNHEVLGFYGSSHGNRLISKTSVGDLIVFYVTKKRIVKGLFEVASAPFLDESPLYGDERDAQWNQRIRLKVIEPEASYDFTVLRWDLDFIKDKGIAYSSYFAPTLVRLSDKDFNTITEAMEISPTRLTAKAKIAN